MRTTLGITSFVSVIVSLGASAAYADVNLWVDDTAGNIGLVDITTGTVSNVVNTGISGGLSDIAFIGNQMYGSTYTNLYSINTATGATTLIGALASGQGGMNALVGSGAGLLGASGSTTEVYNINPTTAATTDYAPSPLSSAGDLAFSGNTLYESGGLVTDALVNVTADNMVGSFGLSGVYGLTDVNGAMYAVAGTEIYSVNLSTATLTSVFNYGRLSALTTARGAASVGENVSAIPEPSTWAMMLAGLVGLTYVARRRRGSTLTRLRGFDPVVSYFQTGCAV